MPLVYHGMSNSSTLFRTSSIHIFSRTAADLTQTSAGLQTKLRRGMFQLLERPPRMLPRIFNPVQLNVDCSAKTPVKEAEGKKAKRGRGAKASGESRASKASGGGKASRPASAAGVPAAGQTRVKLSVCLCEVVTVVFCKHVVVKACRRQEGSRACVGGKHLLFYNSSLTYSNALIHTFVIVTIVVTMTLIQFWCCLLWHSRNTSMQLSTYSVLQHCACRWTWRPCFGQRQHITCKHNTQSCSTTRATVR